MVECLPGRSHHLLGSAGEKVAGAVEGDAIVDDEASMGKELITAAVAFRVDVLLHRREVHGCFDLIVVVLQQQRQRKGTVTSLKERISPEIG